MSRFALPKIAGRGAALLWSKNQAFPTDRLRLVTTK